MLVTMRDEPAVAEEIAQDAGSGTPFSTQQATDPDRVLTTAATLRGRTLFVDSKFDEPVASGPYEVITDTVLR